MIFSSVRHEILSDWEKVVTSEAVRKLLDSGALHPECGARLIDKLETAKSIRLTFSKFDENSPAL